MSERTDEADVVIVGAGPAGLAAAVALREAGVARVLVLDREAEAGGIPRHCGHSPYGFREFRRPMTGPAYARRLVGAAREAGAEIRPAVTVTALQPGPAVDVVSDAGPKRIPARAVLLATGARETPRAQRAIGGTKPGGVLSTGALQGLVYLDKMRPFRNPVILGTELVAFSALLTCRHAGIRPVAIVEPGPRTTARWPAGLLPRLLGTRLWLGTELAAISGRDRVEAVLLRTGDRESWLKTDGVIVTGQFRPEAALLAGSHLATDPATGGPEIDEYGRCSDPAYFAAGNLLRPIETAGWSWAEGRAVAGAIVRALAGELPEGPGHRLSMSDGALRYAVPQRITGGAGPALPRLQLRVARPARGTLHLSNAGHAIATHRINSRPERRITLPLPASLGEVQVRLAEDSS